MRLGSEISVFRTAAFFLVVLFHFAGVIGPFFAANPTAQTIVGWLGRHGSVGTDLFFLLSGLLLRTSLRHGSSWRDAVRRRMLRLYPGFAAIFITYLALAPLAPQVQKLPSDPLTMVLYVGANLLLLPGIAEVTPLVTVAWSLSYIVFGYLLLGGLWRVARSWSLAQRCWLWFAAAAVIGVSGSGRERLLFFPLGALLAEVAPHIHNVRRWRWAATAVALTMLAAVPELAGRALALALLTGAWVPQASPKGISPIFAELAGLSYPVFLSHGLVLHAITRANPVGGTVADFAGTLLATLSLILALAMVFRTWVTEPLEAWVSTEGTKVAAVLRSFRGLPSTAHS